MANTQGGDFCNSDNELLIPGAATVVDTHNNFMSPVSQSNEATIFALEDTQIISQPLRNGASWLSVDSDDDVVGNKYELSKACIDFCKAGQTERNNHKYRWAAYENERPSTWTEPLPRVTIKKGDVLMYNDHMFPNVSIWSEVLDGKMVKGSGITYPDLTLYTGYVLKPDDTVKILSYKFLSDGKWDKKSGSSVQLRNLDWEETDISV